MRSRASTRSRAARKRAQLVLREKEEQHYGVGLLRQLVAVGVVALARRIRQPLDVAVLLPVAVPVQLLELLVALELADDAVAVEGHEHLPAHVLPAAELVLKLAELDGESFAAGLREQPEHLQAVSAIHATITLV